MTPEDKDMFQLDRALDMARLDTPEPSSELMLKIMEDAQEVLAARDGAHAGSMAGRAGKSGWRIAIEALGGWPAMAGLAVSAFVGVWLGANTGVRMAPFSMPLQEAQGVAMLMIDASIEYALGLDEGDF